MSTNTKRLTPLVVLYLLLATLYFVGGCAPAEGRAGGEAASEGAPASAAEASSHQEHAAGGHGAGHHAGHGDAAGSSSELPSTSGETTLFAERTHTSGAVFPPTLAQLSAVDGPPSQAERVSIPSPSPASYRFGQWSAVFSTLCRSCH